MTDLLCLGEPLIEFVRLENDRYQRGFGGDTSNAAIAAARQGASVGYLTALGADRFGDALVDLWHREGIDTTHVRRHASAPTGIYFVDPDPEGRFFTYYRTGSAASLFRPSDLPVEAIRAARCLHLSGITLAVSDDLRETALAAMKLASGAGGIVSLDTNLRLKLWDVQTARSVIEHAAQHAGLMITSVDDSTELLGLTDAAAIAAHYRALGPQIVIVTLGAEGCYLSTSDFNEFVPAAKADPVDSTGAGDSFGGAFLAWLLDTQDPLRAARAAAIVAAGTVSGYGAVTPIPVRSQVLTQLAPSPGPD